MAAQDTVGTADVTVSLGCEEREKAEIAALYWHGFSQKLGLLLGPERRALRFIQKAVEPSHAIVARDAGGKVIGVAGFKTTAGGMVDPGVLDFRQCYGAFGGTWRMMLLARLMMEEPPSRFLVDAIVVAPDQRGKGIGSTLIDRLCQEGRNRGCTEIKLEVASHNTRAKALYERHGFTVASVQRLGILRFVFGFRKAVGMIRPL